MKNLTGKLKSGANYLSKYAFANNTDIYSKGTIVQCFNNFYLSIVHNLPGKKFFPKFQKCLNVAKWFSNKSHTEYR